jgi:RecB family exonuclease
VIDLGDEQVRLSGYADRLELDADGRIVVVDLKTGRSAPSGAAVQRHVQLGLYQLAVDRGAVDPIVEGPVEAGGAELVQLGLEDGSDAAVVQPQGPQADDGAEREQLHLALAGTAAMIRAEVFPAISGQHCRDCDFVSLCPIKGAGSVVSS